MAAMKKRSAAKIISIGEIKRISGIENENIAGGMAAFVIICIWHNITGGWAVLVGRKEAADAACRNGFGVCALFAVSRPPAYSLDWCCFLLFFCIQRIVACSYYLDCRWREEKQL